MVAWRTRNALKFDYFGAVSGTATVFAKDSSHPDNMIFDITINAQGVGAIGVSATGFGHPNCAPFTPAVQTNTGGQPTAGDLPSVH
jgi:hypothetical protein